MKLLSFLLILSMLLTLAACGADSENPADSSDASDTAGTSADSAAPGEDPLDDHLPEETYDGEEISVWLNGGWEYVYLDPETEYTEGDVVDEAVIARDAAVTERFDVTLAFDRDATVGYRDLGALRQSILGGDEYDLFEGVSVHQCALAIYGCYTDLADNAYIDFDRPWWMPFATDALKIGEKQYLGTGYWDFQTVTRTFVFYFNANMAESYGLGNLYDLVNAGDWTFDAMLAMSEKVADDVNQDGVKDENDIYGCGSRWDFWMLQPATSGYQFISVKEDGDLGVTGLTDDLLAIHGKVYPFITANNAYWSGYTYGVDANYNAAKPRDLALRNMFVNDQVLFLLYEMRHTGTEQFRDFGAYGILPSPKYVEGQERYGSSSSSYAASVCTTTGDFDLSCIILEALQAESYKILRPAYFDTALSYKYLNDPQSVEMLDLIFANTVCEWSYNYSKAGISDKLSQCLSREPNLSSFFAANTELVENQLAVFMAQMEALGE